MMTAYEAFKATTEQRRRVADEFIINDVANALRKSIDAGLFSVTVEVHDPNVLTAIDDVLTLLAESRFKVEFVPAVMGTPGYLDINYEVGEE